MNIRRGLTFAAALSLAFVPLVATQSSSVASLHTATGSEAPPSPIPKLPIEPQEDLPDPTTAAESKSNEVSGAIGDVVSELEGFAGRWVDENGLVHLAVQKGYADAITKDLGVRFDGQYELVEVEHSYKDLVSRRDTITTQMSALKEQGLNVMDWGPDEANNTVWISIVDYTDAKANLVKKILGEDILVNASMTEGGVGDLFSRTSDYSPYSAGIFLSSANTPYPMCSSGMPLVVKGIRYLVTAAHCFDPSFGGQFPSNVYNGGAYIGKSNWANFSNNGIDAAVITAPASFTLFRTPTTYINIDSVPWHSAVGETVCSGGAFSGERCSLSVLATNYCSNYYVTRMICGLSSAGKAGGEAAGHGDSGGPMYILSPNKRVSGIIVAAASPQFTCSVQGPVPPGTTRTCSSYIRFQSASSILSYWGTTM